MFKNWCSSFSKPWPKHDFPWQTATFSWKTNALTWSKTFFFIILSWKIFHFNQKKPEKKHLALFLYVTFVFVTLKKSTFCFKPWQNYDQNIAKNKFPCQISMAKLCHGKLSMATIMSFVPAVGHAISFKYTGECCYFIPIE